MLVVVVSCPLAATYQISLVQRPAVLLRLLPLQFLLLPPQESSCNEISQVIGAHTDKICTPTVSPTDPDQAHGESRSFPAYK